MSSSTSGSKGDSDSRNQNVCELLNFFSVIGEDEAGEMFELNAENVLSIPRRIRSLEVIRRGFMCNFLLQNISNIFNAPPEVINIISSLPNAPKGDLIDVSPQTRENLSVNDDGEVELPKEFIIGKFQEVFGAKIYAEITDTLAKKTEEILTTPVTTEQQQVEYLQNVLCKELITPVMQITNDTYGADLKAKETKKLKKQLEQKTDKIVTKEYGDFFIKKKTLEIER